MMELRRNVRTEIPYHKPPGLGAGYHAFVIKTHAQDPNCYGHPSYSPAPRATEHKSDSPFLRCANILESIVVIRFLVGLSERQQNFGPRCLSDDDEPRNLISNVLARSISVAKREDRDGQATRQKE